MSRDPPCSFFRAKSVIRRIDLKIGLRMRADRTYLGSVRSDEDMSAVPAFPHLDLALFKDLPHLYIFQEGTVTLFVMLFDGCDHPELLSQLWKTFFFCSLCKTFIHIGPLIIFAVSRSAQIFSG